MALRVALVAESFYPAVDGTTTTLKNVTDGLIDRGHEVMIVAPAPGLTSYRTAQVRRIRALDKPGSQVRAALEDFGPDLVHVTSPETVGRKALKHARRLGVPTLVVQHSPVADFTTEVWQRRVRNRADLILVTARWMQPTLAELGLQAPVWLPGVDTEAFKPELRDEWLHDKWAKKSSSSGPRVVVGYVGSLHRRHGVRELADLANLPGVRPVIVGEGPQHKWLQARLPGAKFTGALETGALATALASLDVLVHPGRTETCCHVHREAAASGVPVVAPRTGGAAEVVTSLETGLLYDPDNPRGLRRAVESVVGDRHRTLLGARARDLTTRTWAPAVNELLTEHYPAVLGHSAPPSVRNSTTTQ